ncbi:hypothetical protein SEA_FRANCOB_267 [Streptomyces phage Francob]
MTVKLGMYGKGRTSWIDFRDVILSGEAFTISSGTFYGGPCKDASHLEMGRMPQDERENFRALGPEISYVIYSYATPIAWHVRNVGWFRTNAGHSNTTKRHMGKLCGIEFTG